MNLLRIRLNLWLWFLVLTGLVGAPFCSEAADGGTIVTAWGSPYGGEFQFPPGLTNVIQIGVGQVHAAALLPNHTVTAWGYDNYEVTEVPASLTNVVAIAVGANHNLALTTKGTVVQWGLNTPKKLSVKNVKALAAGNDFSLALHRDGTVTAWGGNAQGIALPRQLKKVVAIAAGDSHGLALKSDGTVVSWGANNNGQTNIPAGLSNVVMIAAGYDNSVAITANGAIWQWGQIALISPVPSPPPAGVAQIAVGVSHLVVRATNGTVTGWGAGLFFPVGFTNVATIAAGHFDTLGAIFGPVLRSQPTNLSVLSGSNVLFSVTAESASPFQYQWFFNNSRVAQGTNSTLQLPSVHTNASGIYFVIVSNGFGAVTSSIASLSVTAMNVLSIPQSQSTFTGGAVSFGFAVDSILPLRYQWSFNGNPIPGATNVILTLANIHYPDQGYYTVCVANDDQTRCISTRAFLTVLPTFSVTNASIVKIPGVTNFMTFQLFIPEPRSDFTTPDYQTYFSYFGNETARPNVDYLDVLSTVTFAPGITNVSMSVPIIGSSNAGPKTFTLAVSETFLGGYFTYAIATGFILDSDYVPSISIKSAEIPEGDNTHAVAQEIILSGPATLPVSVNYSTVDGTAQAGLDYIATNGQIIFPSLSTTQKLSLTILGNVLKQTNREFSVVFSQPVNGTLVTNQIKETIKDDDGLTLPPGFAASLIISNLTYPTAMEFAPDGRLFVCEQQGNLRVIKDGVLLPDPFVHVLAYSVPSEGSEAGLLGIAFDPDFATNHYVYIYYTARTPYLHNRVSRFTADGDTAVPGSEFVVLDINPLSFADNHNAGAIHFGPDGKLYIAVGENYFGANAQTKTNLLGKILRINSDGTIPTDNPFYSTTTDANRAIWALGLRNPFSFSFQPGTGRMLINDVGDATWEEINQGAAGANYGWPFAEGVTNSVFQNPIFVYNHTNGCAIVGSAFYNPGHPQFPAEYLGNYFFADYCRGWIQRLDTNNVATNFITGIGSPVALQVGPDGALYCLSGYYLPLGRVYKFTYARSSQFQWARPLPDGRMQFHFNGTPNLPYVLQGSTNLIYWEPLGTNQIQNTEADFFDTPGGLPQRFYRLSQ